MRSQSLQAENRRVRRSRRLATWKRPDAWRSVYSRIVPSLRHRLIREPWIKPAVALHLSAATIQALWRGSAQRQRVKRAAALGLDTAATKSVNVRQDGKSGGGGIGFYMRRRRRRGDIHVRFDRLRGGRGGMNDFEHKVDQDIMFRAWAASRIQAWFRMAATRWRYRYNHYTVYHIASSVIQRAWRGRLNFLRESGLMELHHRRASLRESADGKNGNNSQTGYFKHFRESKPKPKRKGGVYAIQRAWRRYTSRRIFQYYRDLIKFRNAGDPGLMLRSINPREASLFDQAAGIVLRFRLGGQSFPPLIYYKIFTRSPLCDVNAFAPRDYVRSKQPDAAAMNNHPRKDVQQHRPPRNTRKKARSKKRRGGSTVSSLSSIRVGKSFFSTKIGEEDVSGSLWMGDGPEAPPLFAYRRTENNSWRSVTLDVLSDADEDPAKRKIRELGERFHYSRQQRREDRELARKRKKRKWMMRMYREGLAKERPELVEAAAAVNRDGTVSKLREVNFNSDNWETEAENLLEWSDTLDFDAYMDDWSQLGTSTNQRHLMESMIDEATSQASLDFVGSSIDASGSNYESKYDH